MNTAYDTLTSVEDASGVLNQNHQFPAFLRDFAREATWAGASSFVGAFLLHRHFDLAADQEICEVLVKEGAGTSLVSSPQIRSHDQLPHRWMLGPDGWVPLEYSNDAAVARYQQEIIAFMPVFGELLKRNGLEGVLGLGLAARDSLAPLTGEVLFEETVDHASIVRCVEESEQDELFINTLWIPDVTSPQMRCHQWQRCRREGRPPDDRHSYLMGHDRENE